MIRTLKTTIIALFIASATFLIAPWQGNGTAPATHERLRVRNVFSSPVDVVRYYVSRDASGFVWSGLLDIERRAFTTWKSAPQTESFYIAKEYKIEQESATERGKTLPKDEALVRVQYSLAGMGDAHGTFTPSLESRRQVTFHLKKVGGQWKIHSPAPEEISPVVLESKFPYASTTAMTARR